MEFEFTRRQSGEELALWQVAARSMSRVPSGKPDGEGWVSLPESASPFIGGGADGTPMPRGLSGVSHIPKYDIPLPGFPLTISPSFFRWRGLLECGS